MYFQAQQGSRQYEIHIDEEPTRWQVRFRWHEEGQKQSPWSSYDVPKDTYRRLDTSTSFLFKQSSYLMDVLHDGLDFDVYSRGSHKFFKIHNEQRLLHESLKGGEGLGGSNQLDAGMPGKIVEVFVRPGDQLKKGAPVLIMEAMKMENEIRAPNEATVAKVYIKKGQSVEAGAKLVSFK